MSQTINPAPIRKALTVRAAPEKAFGVFTAGMDRWWPRTHTVSKGPLKQVIVEPKVGGRWYGVDAEGREDDWGDVLVWDPPGRLVLAWRINTRFECDPKVHSEVEVRFVDLGDGTCRVEFEHRDLPNLGPGAAEAAASMDRGWGHILDLFRASAEA